MACHITEISSLHGKIVPCFAQDVPFYLAFYVNVRQLYWILNFYSIIFYCLRLLYWILFIIGNSGKTYACKQRLPSLFALDCSAIAWSVVLDIIHSTQLPTHLYGLS